jgi:pimeloyl-ACP methyl ester carboxylesterase
MTAIVAATVRAMTIVFVHGVPETDRLWDGLRAELSGRDTVALSLPGFGTSLPDGFEPTKDTYAAWLIEQLEGMGEPVDLVGHDWGGGFTLRLVSLRPDLVSSWVTDAAGLADVEFEWHDVAKIWQTAGQGEEFMDAQLATPAADRATLFTSLGLSEEAALAMTSAFDRTMADAILTLYRSATKVHEEWGPAFENIPKPGLVIIPSDDAFLDVESARRSAERAGARVADLPGQGHWWAVSDPRGGAQLLEDFWASL